MRRPYFPPAHGDPPPLRAVCERTVRFEEVDSLSIVWHGRYPSYFEDARVALGERHGIGYLELYRQGVAAPIKQMHVDYRLPLRFGDRFTVEGLLHWSDAARLNHEFIIRNEAGEITTTGYTVQMLTDPQGEILLTQPEFVREFCRRWREGEIP